MEIIQSLRYGLIVQNDFVDDKADDMIMNKNCLYFGDLCHSMICKLRHLHVLLNRPDTI